MIHCEYSFVPNCRGRGSNKMHQGENYQDFLKWGGGRGIIKIIQIAIISNRIECFVNPNPGGLSRGSF